MHPRVVPGTTLESTRWKTTRYTPELFREQLWSQPDGRYTPELFPEQLWCQLNGGRTPELFPEQLRCAKMLRLALEICTSG